jgi:biopolymer transport protein ExbB/TolQ
MVVWVVLGVLMSAVLLLLLVSLPVLVRLSRLGRAAERTQRQVAQVQTLQMALAHLQERLVAFQEHTAGVQQRLAARRSSDAQTAQTGPTAQAAQTGPTPSRPGRTFRTPPPRKPG